MSPADKDAIKTEIQAMEDAFAANITQGIWWDIVLCGWRH
jgi:hypothetical protein